MFLLPKKIGCGIAVPQVLHIEYVDCLDLAAGVRLAVV
jgi:hypothetical protein